MRDSEAARLRGPPHRLNPAPSRIPPASTSLGSRLNQRAQSTGLASGSASSTAPTTTAKERWWAPPDDYRACAEIIVSSCTAVSVVI